MRRSTRKASRKEDAELNLLLFQTSRHSGSEAEAVAHMNKKERIIIIIIIIIMLFP